MYWLLLKISATGQEAMPPLRIATCDAADTNQAQFSGLGVFFKLFRFNQIPSIAFSPDGKFLASSGSKDGIVRREGQGGQASSERAHRCSSLPFILS
jgi:WD40 repeat protein